MNSAIWMRSEPWLPIVGLPFTALIGATPLLIEPLPREWISPHATWAGQAMVLIAMITAIAWRVGADGAKEPHSVSLALLFAGLAAAMTAWHYYHVDRINEVWQRQLYYDILNFHPDENGLRIPHQFRPLPYGFVRTLEWLTGDWWFSCIVYRWFFTFWFIWASYRFARLFLPEEFALFTLAPLVLLYPLSVQYYWGQLTDPLSHALFILALYYVVRDQWLLLAASLFLGVLAKETVLLMVISYFACYWRKGPSGFLKTCLLGTAVVVAYFIPRWGLGWRLGFQAINGTTEFMIASNLGIGHPKYEVGDRLLMNYLHPFLFVGIFVPFILWRWRNIDPKLRTIFWTLTPLLMLSNLSFGWMYESRNYMPLVPLLATMTLQGMFSREPLASEHGYGTVT